jgi:hypothetical protein
MNDEEKELSPKELMRLSLVIMDNAADTFKSAKELYDKCFKLVEKEQENGKMDSES